MLTSYSLCVAAPSFMFPNYCAYTATPPAIPKKNNYSPYRTAKRDRLVTRAVIVLDMLHKNQARWKQQIQ